MNVIEMDSDLGKMFKAAIESGGNSGTFRGKTKHSLTNDEQAPILKDYYKIYNKSYTFKEGDLIQLKNGINNPYKYPAKGQPCIVIETYETVSPRHARHSGTPYYAEPEDMRIAIMVPDGDIAVFAFNSKRFEPYKKAVK